MSTHCWWSVGGRRNGGGTDAAVTVVIAMILYSDSADKGGGNGCGIRMEGEQSTETPYRQNNYDIPFLATPSSEA